MPAARSSHHPHHSRDPWIQAGGWLFRHRTSIPLPLALTLLLLPRQELAHPRVVDAAGIALVTAGELIRLWAVRHIGVISRTRSDRLGPLVATGPFAVMRNPLYAGNVLLWAGFALGAHAVWMAIVVFVALGLEYHAIVRWEEQLLETRMGDEYKEYVARVPRWIPTRMRPVERRAASSAVHADSTRVFSWRETFYSERGTLIAIAAGYLLLWAKSRL